MRYAILRQDVILAGSKEIQAKQHRRTFRPTKAVDFRNIEDIVSSGGQCNNVLEKEATPVSRPFVLEAEGIRDQRS